MSIDLDRFLVETANKVAITKNENGDTVYGGTTNSACLYRDIASTEEGGNMTTESADGMLWFGAAEAVELNDVYYHPDEGYLKVVRRIRAKRLVADNSVQFVQCLVRHIRQVS